MVGIDLFLSCGRDYADKNVDAVRLVRHMINKTEGARQLLSTHVLFLISATHYRQKQTSRGISRPRQSPL